MLGARKSPICRPSSGDYEALPTAEDFDCLVEARPKPPTMVSPADHEVPDSPHSCWDPSVGDLRDDSHWGEWPWRLVETGWFQALTAGVIVVNVVTMVLEAQGIPSVDRFSFIVVDQLILCFYMGELACRTRFLKGKLLSGRAQTAFWNALDIIVVTAGVVDQWLLPVLPIERDGREQLFLRFLRCLRVFRVLKMGRIYAEADFSWTERPLFQSFIGGVIVFNSLLMGMETDIEWEGWIIMEQGLLAVYCFELAVRLKRFGVYFLSCYNPEIFWNTLDFLIVVTSLMDTWIVPLIGLVQRSFAGRGRPDETAGPSGHRHGQVIVLMRMLRLMRILRLAKLIKSVRPLYFLVTGVFAALQGVMWVLVLTLTVLYALGIMATRLVGHGLIFPAGQVPTDILFPFKTVPDSMFTLFRVMSGAPSEGEEVALDELMRSLPSAKFSFVFFMITSSWTLLSILTAVVSENMISTTSQQEEEMRLATAEEDRQAQVTELKELFRAIDRSGDGQLEEGELEEFLQDKTCASNVAQCCRVPVRDVKDVLRTMYRESDYVSMDQFVDCLVGVSKTATEQTMLKLQARMSEFQRKTDGGLASLERLMQTRLQYEQARGDELAEAVKRISAALEGLSQRAQHSGEAIGGLRRDVRDLGLEQQGAAEKLRVAVGEAMRASDVAQQSLRDEVGGLTRELTRELAKEATLADLAARLSNVMSKLDGGFEVLASCSGVGELNGSMLDQRLADRRLADRQLIEPRLAANCSGGMGCKEISSGQSRDSVGDPAGELRHFDEHTLTDDNSLGS